MEIMLEPGREHFSILQFALGVSVRRRSAFPGLFKLFLSILAVKHMADGSLEQSESQLKELRQAIQSALATRDYELATELQSVLHRTTAKCDQLRQRQADAELDRQIADLEQTRESEQAAVLASVNERLVAVRQYFGKAYDEIERRHTDAIENIQTRFSHPTYMSIKISSTIRALRRAEAYHVRNEDYRSAGQVRRQIEQQTRAEVSEFEASTRAAIEARVRDARRQYEMERASFAQRLQNEQNIVKRDADRRILAIENRYRRVYHQLTGEAEQTFELTAKFRQELHQIVNKNLAEFLAGLQNRRQLATTEEEDKEVKRPPPRPVSSRPNAPRAASVRRQRNPRVEMALAKTHRQTDLAQKLSDF
jgi:hypothetical protein